MSSDSSTQALSRHLRGLEKSLLLPDVRKSEGLGALLAVGFVEFGSSGRVYTKADLVAALQTETPTAQTTSNFKVSVLSPEIALLTYVIRREATPPVYTLRSSIWQLHGEQWQMVFHQETLTTAPE